MRIQMLQHARVQYLALSLISKISNEGITRPVVNIRVDVFLWLEGIVMVVQNI